MNNNFMRVLKNENSIYLDPRTKILILLIINISAFTASNYYIIGMTFLIPISLIFLDKKYYISFSFILVYIISLFLYIFFIDIKISFISVLVAIIMGFVNRMGPSLLMGYYLVNTTTVSELIAAMEKMKIPKSIIISLSVMFRFFPTIKEEILSINNAMKMRGISFGKSKGGVVALIEYKLVPLFISCIKIGDELSCSALTRGLGNPNKRTNICNIGFSSIDFLYICISILTFISLIYIKGV
ncbi:MAG: energy-coupling factor transporter transmembrane protein EcfT [Peptostreptococcaceae bacterium]|nr:energy-coupling factor transporter transmembrane protein EcfT [Peptostreptococcaceae bacterium]